MLVATNAENLAAVEATLKTINPNVQYLSVPTNIADAGSVAALFAKVKENFGHADILVNNAASSVGGGNIHEEDPEQWWRNFVRPLLAPSPPNSAAHFDHSLIRTFASPGDQH